MEKGTMALLPALPCLPLLSIALPAYSQRSPLPMPVAPAAADERDLDEHLGSVHERE